MKNKWNGLFILLVGVALFCCAFIIKGLEATPKIVICVIGALVTISGASMLRKKSIEAENQTDPVKEEARYEAKRTVLSAPEARLYAMLRQMLEGRAEILPQVALVSIVNKINYTSFRNELFRIVDFVICAPDFRPVVAVELNDSSHKRRDRQERDRKVAEILSKAGVQLVTLELEELEDYARLKRKIYSAIK